MRETLSAPKLYALLYREFRAVRNPACPHCRMPLPFYRAPADEFTANWHIGTPRRCERGCHLKIAEIAARLWTRYDLRLPVERRHASHPELGHLDRPFMRTSGDRRQVPRTV